jgi:hypothetical protein
VEEREVVLISRPKEGQKGLTIDNGLIDQVNIAVGESSIKLLASTVVTCAVGGW